MTRPLDPVSKVLTVLGCLAVEPRLGGVLFFDLNPALLPPLARWLADRLPGRPAVVTLGAQSSEEQLWLRTRFTGDTFDIGPGLLVEEPGEAPPVIVVPDLGHAGGPTGRAAVALIGADVGYAEMLGQSMRWHPRARWLAAVSRADASRLSAHLLDRFTLRVEGSVLGHGWSPVETLAALTSPADEAAALREALPALPLPARETLPDLSAAALEQVVATVPARSSHRRDLALARVARVLAGSAGARTVTADHVDEAAELLGMTVSPATPEDPEDDRAEPPPPPVPPASLGPATTEPAPTPGQALPRPTPVVDTGPAAPLEALPPQAIEPDVSPYPEDDLQALPVLGSLRAYGGRRTVARRLRERPVGIGPATDLHDLAIAATVLEAAKFQAIRRRSVDAPPGRLIISPADLRRPRRQPEPDSALVLVLDHSCWAGWDRSPVMAPYLRRAYHENSAVSVIEFGHRDSAAELIAERYRTSSLLDPRVPASLSRASGRASPLAHALDLALNELLRYLRHGRVPVDACVLLVATDGRGNVPLAVSLLGAATAKVGRTGITDAITVASAIRALPRIQTVVVSPDVDQYAELPFDLADTMGGLVILASRTDGPMR